MGGRLATRFQGRISLLRTSNVANKDLESCCRCALRLRSNVLGRPRKELRREELVDGQAESDGAMPTHESVGGVDPKDRQEDPAVPRAGSLSAQQNNVADDRENAAPDDPKPSLVASMASVRDEEDRKECAKVRRDRQELCFPARRGRWVSACEGSQTRRRTSGIPARR